MNPNRKLLLAFLLGLSLATATTYAWSATWNGTSWITNGGVIDAQKIAENLEYLKNKVDALEEAGQAKQTGFGVGQKWQSVSRSYGTTYTNTTSKPIMVSTGGVTNCQNCSGSTRARLTAYVDGVEVAVSSTHDGQYYFWYSSYGTVTFVVPVGSSYSVSQDHTNKVFWSELR